ncbi:MAG: N-acetyl-gamma-glutamyl-phosphate reductase [Defluviitaleaceae bacterium]|nr:N-acetyl-gamma-glutamyl-phosphate reductase [Defluviitaleaceae bacterium]
MKVFIDGNSGTTGLQLEERLRGRPDISLMRIDDNARKDPAAKKQFMEQVDVIFLCLPDDAARESVAIAPAGTLVIDASTAHRTAPGWAYGFPELSEEHRAAVRVSKRISNPGCHSSGFIALIYPLVASGMMKLTAKLNCTSLTGYSGGGRSMIETYETGRTPRDHLHAPRPYALGLTHKHLPEMKAQCGLEYAPHFYPVVGDMAQGMVVSIQAWAEQFSKAVSPEAVWEVLARHYEGSHFIRVMPFGASDEGSLDPTACNGSNRMELFVFGHESQILLAARLDNLGKGASGSAVQCMNIACGLDEQTGLT